MKNKAVFLDRDGVLNKERGEYTYKSKDFEWVPNAIDALKILTENDFLLIIISNQGGISKNLYGKTDVLNIENSITVPLEKEGIRILDSYYCPHHSAIGKMPLSKAEVIIIGKGFSKV